MTVWPCALLIDEFIFEAFTRGECVAARRQIDFRAVVDQRVKLERRLLAIAEDQVGGRAPGGIGDGQMAQRSKVFARRVGDTEPHSGGPAAFGADGQLYASLAGKGAPRGQVGVDQQRGKGGDEQQPFHEYSIQYTLGGAGSRYDGACQKSTILLFLPRIAGP